MCRPVLFSILTQKIKESIIRHIVPGSSMVEQEAVNFEVAGSSPAPGAILDESPFFVDAQFGVRYNRGYG